MELSFTKMSALGNDFIVVDGAQFSVESLQPSIEFLCDRHFGIGADGIIFVLPSTIAHYRMRIFNSDGSEAEMCGNGIRCFAHYLHQQRHFTTDTLTVETMVGTLSVSRVGNDYRVDMGVPKLLSSSPCSVDTSLGRFSLHPVSMGNPHAVIFTDTPTDDLVHDAGREIETDTLFPQRTNVEFATIQSRTEINLRVWERACGETLACGTGACAAVVAGIETGQLNTVCTVHLRGGDLTISWDGKSTSPVWMTGSAGSVFTGTIAIAP